MLYLSEKWTDF